MLHHSHPVILMLFLCSFRWKRLGRYNFWQQECSWSWFYCCPPCCFFSYLNYNVSISSFVEFWQVVNGSFTRRRQYDVVEDMQFFHAYLLPIFLICVDKKVPSTPNLINSVYSPTTEHTLTLQSDCPTRMCLPWANIDLPLPLSSLELSNLYILMS